MRVLPATRFDECCAGSRAHVQASCLFLVVVVAGLAPAALALNGRADLWNTWQSGGAGLTAYDNSTLTETYRLDQRIVFMRGLDLLSSAVARRQHLESSFDGATSKSHSEYASPSLLLNYETGAWRSGLSGLASRRDYWYADGTSRRDDYAEYGGWSRLEFAQISLEARALEIGSWREANGTSRENREHRQSGRVEVDPTRFESVQYQFTRSDQRAKTQGHETEYVSHEVQLRSARAFADHRGRYSLQATGSRFRQTNTAFGSGATILVPPIWSGYSLDDTPGILDPLELDPVAVTALADGDRDTPTVINIGDSASIVRQYGGDFRNLIVDFGEAQTMASVVLYVDRIVRFPDLIAWSVYVSDDPEGREWGDPLSAGQVSVVWDEMADNRQGWVFTFATPIAHRRLKLVDQKFGPTEADLYVNEMEVYEPAPGSGDTRVRSTLDRYRVQGDIGYDLTTTIGVRYSTSLTGRHYDTDDRDVYGMAHVFGASWRPGPVVVSADHQINRVISASRQNTDVTAQHVSVATARRADLRARVAWSRVNDQSDIQRRTTNSWTGDVTWDAKPRLTFAQKVTYGIRDAQDVDGQSHSWVLVSDVRGAPRPYLDLHLRRADRWVNQEAGSGFTPFNDTSLDVNWSIRPLVFFNSQVLYQVRDEDAWLLRNTLSWTPLPGGSMNLRLYLTDQQDTRTDYVQRGAGWGAVWKARRHLRFEGGAEWTLVKQHGDRNTPTNWNVRGTWTF